MIIYIDENLPPILSKGFNLLQDPMNRKLKLKDPIEIKSIKDVFGSGTKDEDWISKLSEGKDCVITQDLNIHRIREQRMLCEQYKLGIFFLKPPSKNGYGYWDIVKLLVKHWEEIIKKASKDQHPFSYKITPSKNKIEKLN